MRTLRQTLQAWLKALHGDTRGTSMVTTAVTLPLLILLIFGIFGLFRLMMVKWVFDRGTREAARYISEEARFWDLQPASGTPISETLPADYYDIEAKRIILSRLGDVIAEKTIYDIITHTLVVSVTEPILANAPGATPDPNYVVPLLTPPTPDPNATPGTVTGSMQELCDWSPRGYSKEQPGTFRPANNIRFRVYAEMDLPLMWLPRLPYASPITPTLKFKQRAIGYVQCARWSGEREANDPQIDKVERYSREGPALDYRFLATPYFPTVTAVPTYTTAPPATATPTPTP